MIVFFLFFAILLIVYYYRLSYVIHSLLLLEFMSFCILSFFGLSGYLAVLGQFYVMVVFLVFVLEGVIGIISIILFTNYSGSSIIKIISAN